MARQRKLSPERKAFIDSLIEHYQPEDAQDVQEMLKDLLGDTLQEMLEAEMDAKLSYSKYNYKETADSRNGYSKKTVVSSLGEIDLNIPRDRKGEFTPTDSKKNQKDISDIHQNIISMYAKGMTTRQVSDTLEDIYGFEASEGFISDVTDKIMSQIENWQNRPLSEVYPVLYIDAIHYFVRDNGVIRKLATYVILGINNDGYKEVLTIEVGKMKALNTGFLS